MNFQILNLFALTLLGIIAKNPTIIHHSSDNKLDDDGIDTLPTPVSRNILEQDLYRDHSLNHNDIDMVKKKDIVDTFLFSAFSKAKDAIVILTLDLSCSVPLV